MTPLEVETAARQRLNSVGDNLWSSDEINSLIFAACQEMARECLIIERLYSTVTVASQQAYSLPTNYISIKRITCDGNKLQPISFREDDALTLSNSIITSTGTPQYYALWQDTIYLRPIPSASALALSIFTYNGPQTVSSTSTLEIPTIYHSELINYLLAEMNTKEKNYEGAQIYRNLWMAALKKITAFNKLSKRGDASASVQDQDTLPMTYLGLV